MSHCIFNELLVFLELTGKSVPFLVVFVVLVVLPENPVLTGLGLETALFLGPNLVSGTGLKTV